MSHRAGVQTALRTLGLEKVAVSVDQMLKGLRSAAKLVRYPARLPSIANPAGAAGGPGMYFPGIFERSSQLVKNAPPELRPRVSAALSRSGLPAGLPVEGTIIWPRGNLGRRLRKAVKILNQRQTSGTGIEMPSRLSPDGHRALNVLAANHEMREGQVPHRQISRFKSHASPRLVAGDHNALINYTGPGADEARQYKSLVRGPLSGDNDYFNQFLERWYGPRAVAEFGAGGTRRIPKALIKDFERRYTKHFYEEQLPKMLP